MKHILIFILLIFSFLAVFAQKNDSLKTKFLKEVTVKDYRLPAQKITQLPDVQHTFIFGGKKSEVINIQSLNANIAEKTGRQIFAKIAGVFVYDMDGSGNQVNISTRGLDPHRSWEMNIRHNGTITNSDMYGYPASHYSPPMESIQKVELVRGTGSLQYGAQFGGMVNYQSKQADSTKKIGFEGINTVGSFGLRSSYNAIGGKVGKLSYYAYFHKRVSDGYRDNGRSDSESQFVSLTYKPNSKLTLKAELGHSIYLYQLAGQLTDKIFEENPRQSSRFRNWYSPDIYLPSFSLLWQVSKNTKISLTTSAVLGFRNSVIWDRFANVKDTINQLTKDYNARQVDIDNFNSYTSELRILQHYKIKNVSAYFSSGLQYMNNDLHRRQQGKGTTGSDFDLSVTEPNFGRDLHYKTQNIAFFVENVFKIGKKLSLTQGFRLENGATNMTGYISYLDSKDVPNQIKHHFPLFGFSAQYQIDSKNQFYAGFSQAYRPVIFKDIIPASILEKADKNLKNAYGYNAEIGFRGEIFGKIKYDITAFQLIYQNRLGSLALIDENGNSYIYRTNIGNSQTIGIESLVEWQVAQTEDLSLSAFSSTAYFQAKYTSGNLIKGKENQPIKGNWLEGVPQWTSRNGVNFSCKNLSISLLYSYVGKSYADAFNTETPSANGAVGLVPSYGILDWNMSYYLKKFTFRLGLNNLLDKQYFTKRPTFYPGAGIWSSDGRGITFSLGFKI
ncbi:MAG: TonB-dependent receptor [Cytophagales bacterium]|nr:MAG: TonB-dependent receptor [Cytophagales bacterium]